VGDGVTMHTSKSRLVDASSIHMFASVGHNYRFLMIPGTVVLQFLKLPLPESFRQIVCKLVKHVQGEQPRALKRLYTIQ